jgi:putative protease
MTDKTDKVGIITHFYSKIGVGIIKLLKELKKGDNINIKGHKTDFKQEVEEMQFDHKDIASGKKGQEIGIKLNEKVREGDEVFFEK